MTQRSALSAMTAVLLVTVAAGCGKRGHGGAGGEPPGGGRGGRGGGAVDSEISFSGSNCDIRRADRVSAHSGDDVTWPVTVHAPCDLEGQTVEIMFTDGDPSDPAQRCQCTDTVRNNKAKLKLKVKTHGQHQGYTYYIKAGARAYHPRLEVDP
jgi:hypothetical protein